MAIARLAFVAMDKHTKNTPTQYESTPGFVIQAHRLSQIVWVITAAIFTSLIFVIVTGMVWDIVERLLVVALFIFMFCLWLIYKKKAQYATTLLTFTLSVMACSLIYTAQGLHDEAVAILPAILLLACMFGSRLQFCILLVALIGFLSYILLAHVQGWHIIPDHVNTDIYSLINVTVILLASGFFAFVLASDLRKALDELNRSKKELLDLNDQLETRVNQRTAQYESSNVALQESMDKLEQAMNELVHVEKLASLGSMVAGISHELNTPIGNTLLAATSMEKLFEEVSQKFQDGNIKRSAFDIFLKEGLEISSLITRSSKRSADMVVSF